MNTLDASVSRTGLRTRIGEFFYAREVPYGLAIVRIVLTFTLLFPMVVRWSHARELYSSDGAAVPLWIAYGLPPLFPEPSGTAAVAILTLMILTLATSCIGWCTRLSLIAATTSYVYLNLLDSIGTINKYSVIASHMLFLMCFSHCGSVWSIDNWLRRSRLRNAGVPPEIADEPLRFASWPRRLVQIMIGAVYLGAAATKIHTPVFFTGEQLQTWMITDYNVPNYLGSHFALQPSFLVIFAYVTIVWEIIFLFTAWRGLTRTIMLSLGTFFHFMTFLTLGLWAFPPVCISSYFAFLNETDIERLRTWFGRWSSRERGMARAIRDFGSWIARWRAPSLGPGWSHGVFAALALSTMAAGVAAEYKLDPYGIRRPEGPYGLKELDPAYVASAVHPTERIRNEDKLLTLDVGSFVVGGAVIDRKSEFHPGDTVWVQCGLVPPHEDLWLSCNLLDNGNCLYDSIDVFVGYDAMRTSFYYTIGKGLQPGRYWLAMRIGGEEVMRRPITVLPLTKGALTKGPLAN